MAKAKLAGNGGTGTASPADAVPAAGRAANKSGAAARAKSYPHHDAAKAAQKAIRDAVKGQQEAQEAAQQEALKAVTAATDGSRSH